MSDPFALRVGGGYLDSSGNFTFTLPDGAQLYHLPDGVKLDPKFVDDILKDLKRLLPDGPTRDQWIAWGVPPQLIDFFGSAADVMKVVSAAISIYTWAVGVLFTIMKFIDDGGKSGMSPELANALLPLKAQMAGAAQIQQHQRLNDLSSPFYGAIGSMQNKLKQVLISTPTGADRAALFGEMMQIVDGLAEPLAKVMHEDWVRTYDPDLYKGRAFASLLFVSPRSDGTTPGVPMQPPTVNVFDYRIGAPTLVFTATTFASLAQVAVPWFRSAGIYAEQFRELAATIDTFVVRTQDECLARTQYDATGVLQQLDYPIAEIPWLGINLPNAIPTLAVGAFDLAAYHDSFLNDKWSEHFSKGEDTGQRGLFNYHWQPADPLAPVDLQATADILNELSRRQYAQLQTVTGMFRLAHLAAWLRFLSTPPDRSQTVSGSTHDSRAFVSQEPTVAKSPKIFPNTVIEAPATLKHYDARSRAPITTQAPGYRPPCHYRVLRRTIDCASSDNEGWWNHPYLGDVWQTSYEPTSGDPRCMRLRTDYYASRVLDERLLYEGPSPAALVSKSHAETMQATTFDWYVPVETPGDRYVGKYPAVAAVKALTGKNNGGTSMHIMSGGSPLGHVNAARDFDVSILESLEAAELADAERRHVKRETVDLTWELSWQGNQLEVRVSGNPAQRPFQIYVVVEETVYSGQSLPDAVGDILGDASLVTQLHTPFALEIANQLVFVPASFFREERDALDRAGKLWHDLIRRFSEVAPVGPGDPIENLGNRVREILISSPSTATLAQITQMRADFATQHAPKLWKEVQRDGAPQKQAARRRST